MDQKNVWQRQMDLETGALDLCVCLYFLIKQTFFVKIEHNNLPFCSESNRFHLLILNLVFISFPFLKIFFILIYFRLTLPLGRAQNTTWEWHLLEIFGEKFIIVENSFAITTTIIGTGHSSTWVNSASPPNWKFY